MAESSGPTKDHPPWDKPVGSRTTGVDERAPEGTPSTAAEAERAAGRPELFTRQRAFEEEFKAVRIRRRALLDSTGGSGTRAASPEPPSPPPSADARALAALRKFYETHPPPRPLVRKDPSGG